MMPKVVFSVDGILFDVILFDGNILTSQLAPRFWQAFVMSHENTHPDQVFRHGKTFFKSRHFSQKLFHNVEL